MALTYRDKGSSNTQLDVRSGSISIGNISKELFSATAGGGGHWRWHLWIEHYGMPPGVTRTGSAGSLEAAKADLERNWVAWVAAAGLKNGD